MGKKEMGLAVAIFESRGRSDLGNATCPLSPWCND